MKIFHVVRNAPDWLSLQKEEHYDAHVFNDFVKNKMKEIFKLWNEILTPNYFVFRNKIAEIAKNNHALLPVDKFYNSALHIEKELFEQKPPYLVVFTDDDDWHNHNLVNVLKKTYEKNLHVDAILWSHAAFCSNYKQFDKNGKNPFFIFKKDLNFYTNNYALTDNFFKKIDNKDIKLLNYGIEYELFYGHNNIEKFFKNRLIKIKIPDWLSMSNKNITSYSFWLNNNSFKDIEDVIKKYKCIQNIDVDNRFEWAKKSINDIIYLYKQLKIKKNLL